MRSSFWSWRILWRQVPVLLCVVQKQFHFLTLFELIVRPQTWMKSALLLSGATLDARLRHHSDSVVLQPVPPAAVASCPSIVRRCCRNCSMMRLACSRRCIRIWASCVFSDNAFLVWRSSFSKRDSRTAGCNCFHFDASESTDSFAFETPTADEPPGAATTVAPPSKGLTSVSIFESKIPVWFWSSDRTSCPDDDDDGSASCTWCHCQEMSAPDWFATSPTELAEAIAAFSRVVSWIALAVGCVSSGFWLKIKNTK